ncbi:Gfo/Idh/MocA family protein [Flagellimonas lutaonensis]|uniref:Oxidoreductase, Gfo/Idh/MocA family, putative n=1 Tax=Flagellimonas lutaonensis TaxID=516051 RepID=A0A0D5YR44_9FLAO|nr:Gfo/Idh/MocA family oxidoreductase [Allomuricauda lutaonensis]AKA34755.1 Oxidoreductase, Gfo/Idh/MocA family, putative [Allomuricauda lutaonensis]
MALKPYFDKGPIRWGFIGCGAVTEVKSGPAYQMTDGFEGCMVMRRDIGKARDYAYRHGIPKYTDNAAELIESPLVDAVYIATPPDTHKYYALQVAEAGKPCCVEKPMAPSFRESLSICQAFEEKNLPLFIAHYRRSLPRFNQVKQWLAKSLIGDVRHIRWHLGKPPNRKDLNVEYNWRTDPAVAPGGYFDDLASHGLDLFSYFFGSVKKAQGFARNQMGLYKAFDNIVGNWVYESGVTGQGSWNFGAHEREDVVEIYGSKGKIVFSVFDEAPIQLTTEARTESLLIENPKHIQHYHVENIKRHLIGDAKHPSLGVDGLHISWLMDQILGKQ